MSVFVVFGNCPDEYAQAYYLPALRERAGNLIVGGGDPAAQAFLSLNGFAFSIVDDDSRFHADEIIVYLCPGHEHGPSLGELLRFLWARNHTQHDLVSTAFAPTFVADVIAAHTRSRIDAEWRIESALFDKLCTEWSQLCATGIHFHVSE